MTSGEFCGLMLVLIFLAVDSINDKLKDIRKLMKGEKA